MSGYFYDESEDAMELELLTKVQLRKVAFLRGVHMRELDAERQKYLDLCHNITLAAGQVTGSITDGPEFIRKRLADMEKKYKDRIRELEQKFEARED
jgi:hypothetical protein